MKPELSNHQPVPSLSSPVSAVTDVLGESGGGQTLSCVYPATQPPVTFPLPNYYVATTSATHWPPPQYISPPLPPVSHPAYAAPTKPEMTFLVPVCVPSSDAGHVMSPSSVGNSPTLVTPPPVAPLNPLMNSTKYVGLVMFTCATVLKKRKTSRFLDFEEKKTLKNISAVL